MVSATGRRLRPRWSDASSVRPSPIGANSGVHFSFTNAVLFYLRRRCKVVPGPAYYHYCADFYPELLLEVIPSKVGPVEADTSARIIQRFYDRGVYPDWWKLEPFKTEAEWRNAVQARKVSDSKAVVTAETICGTTIAALT